ncbi:MAG: DnaD domain protein [Ruminococcaceae bacterium]|nr:DnaD domain protein [Oscillospiraceae bacterium]
MSQLKINFETSALVLPGKVMEVMNRASFLDIKVLLCLCANADLRAAYGSEGFADRVAEAVDGDADSVQAALAFWRGAGLLIIKGSSKATTGKSAVTVSAPTPPPAANINDTVIPEQTQPAKLRAKAELPHYTTEQLAALLTSHADTANWLDECQRIFGKVFNTLEVNTFLGFVDYLGLDWEYIMVLLTYYVGVQERRGMNKSVRGVEKMAFDLYDKGIHTVDELQEEIRRLTLFSETEGSLRTLFGMGKRSLTPKEKKCFSTWLYEYQFDMEVIRLAYEVTVDAKGEPNISYMNSVLANWHKDNLHTPEAVRAAAEARKASPTASTTGGRRPKTEVSAGSFDVEDFFAAAVRRSLGEDTPPEFQTKDQT